MSTQNTLNDAISIADAAPELERSIQQPSRRSALRALVQDFGPIWFTWCMNAGALAQLIANCPYRFNGIYTLADIFCVKAILMYTAFTCIFLTRLFWFKREAYNEIVNPIVELTFVPCWDVAFMTLNGGVSLIVSNAWWGGYRFTIPAAFCSIVRREILASSSRLPTSIIIPAVSVATVAITGASIATYAKGLSATLAVPMMIVLFYWVGAGFFLGLILYVFLLQEIATKGWPHPDQTRTIFLFVGPMGQSAAALQILGAAAIPPLNRFGEYNSGIFLNAQSAQRLAASCTLMALLMNGLGVFWTSFGIWLVIKRARERTLKWNPAWNAAIFPNSTLATSFLVFAEQMDLPAYRVLGCIMLIILVVVYLVNFGFALIQIGRGHLLIVRENWRVQQREAEEQKDR